MKFKTPYTALFFLSLTIFLSCSKDDDPPVNKTRKDLVVGDWVSSGLTETPAIFDYNSDGIKDSDVFVYLQTCVKDNILSFKANGEYEQDEGATKCSPSAPQKNTGSTWNLSADEKILFVGSFHATILQLDENVLRFRQKLRRVASTILPSLHTPGKNSINILKRSAV